MAKKDGKKTKTKDDSKDLVCVFLGLELYTTKKAATLLKTEMMELLRTDLKEIPVLAVKTHEPLELTPSLSFSWDKVRSLVTKGSEE